jgi:hypothetical protein
MALVRKSIACERNLGHITFTYARYFAPKRHFKWLNSSHNRNEFEEERASSGPASGYCTSSPQRSIEIIGPFLTRDSAQRLTLGHSDDAIRPLSTNQNERLKNNEEIAEVLADLALALGAHIAAHADPPPWSNGHHNSPIRPRQLPKLTRPSRLAAWRFSAERSQFCAPGAASSTRIRRDCLVSPATSSISVPNRVITVANRVKSHTIVAACSSFVAR